MESNNFNNQFRYQYQPQPDRGSFLIALLGFIMPLVGIIMFFIWRMSRPRRARSAIMGAVIGIAFEVVTGVILATFDLFGQIISFFAG